ncbi:ATP-binding protein [Candidatus Parcubacteria bacterium]|nr:ATP-binding protein [Candidatus Parcubacteria bacterium]
MNAPQEILEEVEREYEETLVIPAAKPSPQWMLMPVGVIGVGKTTVVKPIAERMGLVRVSTDDIRERLKAHGYSYEGARDIAHRITKKYLSLGYSVAIDGNTGSTNGLEYNKKTLEAFPQVRQLFIHINPPDEFVVKKLKNYNHTWLFRDGDHAVEAFLTNKKNFVLPDLPFVYTFDTSKDLSGQLDAGIEVINTALKSPAI